VRLQRIQTGTNWFHVLKRLTLPKTNLNKFSKQPNVAEESSMTPGNSKELSKESFFICMLVFATYVFSTTRLLNWQADVI
jgi:hypothetical protein